MNLKNTLLKQILVRIALLVLPLLGVYLMMVFTYDPHKYCTANEHRHTMGPVGYLVLGVFVTMVWVLAIVFEMIWRYFKKDWKISITVYLLLVLAISLIIFLV